MPDPFTAAVAAAVTGSSAAQAEYYQAYQQYYQQYYASQYAAQFYGVSSSGDSVTAVTSGISATAGNLSTTVTSGSQGGDPTSNNKQSWMLRLRHCMPDPFTAAVAAAVTGSSAAQAEYYQAYQQYYQQYYASQYAAQFYGVSSSGDSVTAVTSGISATAGNLSTTVTSGSQGGDPTVQQQAVLDATASALYARALARAQSMGSLEYSPGMC
ncbi:hypothetical protein AHF37_07601 [Paragonimus kellicotti]|nr:hypothetical protein AHF37_07601 [Paragonimus kellicotti]